ncbi:hypothetical protein [Metabacillus fastidiosus]|uniref:Uncharacterized protein n=1 Tax=Metabacillus fastidiosus TaxID=1458 RepID=A0ABU6NUL4_9BACI|nr:hypothetical protein [Metabacillus fastidiosus]MED4400827.1 hypothetical protein [Metabacillus fastidiosus]MED4463755.1 hypothetical protein [Metabacillus fastidiosus]
MEYIDFDSLMEPPEIFSYDMGSTSSYINRSGNSDVDVNIDIQLDTMPIALALLCLSFANKQLTRKQFEAAVEELVEVTDRYKKGQKKRKGESKVKLFNEDKTNKVQGRY